MALIFWYFAFHRFSQTFIDIREKERKRLQRGLVSVPPKYPKLDDDKLVADQRNESNNGTANGNVSSSTTTSLPINRDDNPNGFKPEHLLELQEKITKEILSTKLQENEMHELQVPKPYIVINRRNPQSHGSDIFMILIFHFLQAKINHEILNSKVFNLEHQGLYGKKSRIKSSASSKARSLMNLHNNEAGRRVT